MESHIIELTQAAQKYGNLNIRCCGKNFFPQDVFGGSDNSKPGVPIILKVDGITELIETDIPTDATTGRPRWIFRERAWVKQFVRCNKLTTGNTVVISRVDERTYKITPNNGSHHQQLSRKRVSEETERPLLPLQHIQGQP